MQGLQNTYKFPKTIPPIFEEGLYLASPEFWQEFQKASFQMENEKLERSFSKYWLRSCTRCTPYGTFAGSALVNVSDDETNLVIDDGKQHLRRVRIDMNYLANLIAALTKMPAILEQVKFHPNNSIYPLSDTLRYAEYTVTDNTRYYRLTSIEKTSAITAVLEEAKQGATIEQLVARIVECENVEEDQARAFIIGVWESQLLVSELEPCVTGKEPLDRLIEQLSPLKDVDDLTARLREIQLLLQHPQEGVEYYQRIEKKLKDLDLSLQVPKSSVQTDLFLSMHSGSFNKSLVNEITLQVSHLMALARPNINADLESFKTKFHARYEDAEIPLNIALDADLGIGYAGVNADTAGKGELIDNLAVAVPGRQSNGSFDYITKYTLTRYQDFLQNNRPFIEITEEDLNAFRRQAETLRFPGSMYIMGDLMKKNGRLDPENFIFDLSAFGGPSAGNLLGRFTHGEERICSATREMLKQEEEEYPDAIYAEIAHLPQARTGNILLRPILRSYEIPYVGKSGIAAEDQIPVDDLVISIKRNEVILRSKRFDRRIIPRLTTAHNFAFDSLPIYKFLCDLQNQGLSYPNVWDWGHLEILKHLPRVAYKNIIIKKARWMVEEKDIKDLPANESEYGAWFDAFCKKWNIPSRVVYMEYDLKLPIDFAEATGIRLFLHYLKRNKTIFLEEFLFTEENCIVKDANERVYTDELIIPVFRDHTEVKQPPAFPIERNAASPIKRKYSPHSEWLYFKVYSGPKMAERILKELVLPFVEMATRGKLMERFFFVRYRDEFPHLRIRFFNTEIDKQLPLQKEFMGILQPFLDNGLIHNVAIDTYSPELERYGEHLIEEAEGLFYNDSLAVLRFIDLLEEKDEKYRLLFALRGIDGLLSDFNLDTREKAELAKEIQQSYFKEFGAHPNLQKQLNAKYRKVQQMIFSHMDSTQDNANEIEEAVSIFRLRCEMNKPMVDRILSKLPPGQAKQRLVKMLPNYIHMFMNRLFIAQQRKYELVTYHFLEKYYTSQAAIQKQRLSLFP